MNKQLRGWLILIAIAVGLDAQWEGGALAVLQKQTQDLNQFITDWTGS